MTVIEANNTNPAVRWSVGGMFLATTSLRSR
jgi:hypothetical protein